MNDMTNKCCKKCFSTYTEHDYPAHTVYDACICIDTLCECHSKEMNMETEKTKEHCSHDFEYSHQVIRPQYTTGANFDLVDVTVCTKCGEVRRN